VRRDEFGVGGEVVWDGVPRETRINGARGPCTPAPRDPATAIQLCNVLRTRAPLAVSHLQSFFFADFVVHVSNLAGRRQHGRWASVAWAMVSFLPMPRLGPWGDLLGGA